MIYTVVGAADTVRATYGEDIRVAAVDVTAKGGCTIEGCDIKVEEWKIFIVYSVLQENRSYP